MEGVDGTCMTLLAALSSVIVALAIYVSKLWSDRDRERRSRIRYLEDLVRVSGSTNEARDPSVDS